MRSGGNSVHHRPLTGPFSALTSEGFIIVRSPYKLTYVKLICKCTNKLQKTSLLSIASRVDLHGTLCEHLVPELSKLD